MTPKRQHDGDCTTIIENKPTDPPVRNSLLVSILLSVVGVLIVGFFTIVWSQVSADRQAQATIAKELLANNAAQDLKIKELETSYAFIINSLIKIEANTQKTAEKVEALEKRIPKNGK